MIALLVAVGSGLGAAARLVVDRNVSIRFPSVFPWGTLTVNVLGSFGLGLLATSTSGVEAAALVGAGGLGGFTTVSTFGYETVRLLRSGAWLLGAANALGNVGLGLLAAAGGVALATWLG